MDDVLDGFLFVATATVLFAALLAALSSVGLLGSAFWPRRAEEAREALEASLVRTILLGEIHLALWFVLLIVADELDAADVVAPLVLLPVVFFVLCGFPALAALAGERVRALGDLPTTPLSATVTGTCVLGAACLVPWLGWFLLPLLVAGAAYGAGVSAVVGRMRRGLAGGD